VSCLIMILRDRFTRDGQTESHPILGSPLRPGSRESRHARPSHPWVHLRLSL